MDYKRGYRQEAFSYQTNKDESKVFVYWRGKQVTILKDKETKKFLRKIEGMEHKEAQLVMAKLTGNFKRGNERDSKRRML
ncbi:hypothetical protein KDA_54500 [Dictyobacter alpinus]|uniref:Uncharacterized protein n=1 Tax=Dictyobacter alpinus TaxID=2014873 RepID=A0A402BF76_9CHLR|nr:hypothetical protein [Dictyobacter alpinus]GCE29966.1 hypothetical protein KDA_54500 [Dictyobacter alpinus]